MEVQDLDGNLVIGYATGNYIVIFCIVFALLIFLVLSRVRTLTPAYNSLYFCQLSYVQRDSCGQILVSNIIKW